MFFLSTVAIFSRAFLSTAGMHITSTNISPFLVLASFTMEEQVAETGGCSGLALKLPEWFYAVSQILTFDKASSKVYASYSNSRSFINEEVIPVMNSSQISSLWNS